MRILIAEDDSAFRRLLEEILVEWGYGVVATRDGNEAWQALKAENPPQLAILDWMMPGMDGVEICSRVRQELPEPYTYIILLTSHQRDEDLVVGMEAGADDYLTKPLKTNELKVRLNAGRRIINLQNELIAARETVAAHAVDLETANRDLEALGYTVANDILRSLMAIGDYSKAIEEMVCSKQDEQCRSYTRRIYEKTRRLGELIAVMHDFFRPTRGELHRESVDLSGMANETAAKLRKTSPQRQVTFRITGGINANGDAELLKVVLENLFDNAWKHTSQRDDAVIEFGMTETEEARAYFVRDNGIGFSVEDVDRLFKPFQRIPGTEGLAGRGVGLAMVERIIRRHGGRVWAEGERGEGATFWFTLP